MPRSRPPYHAQSCAVAVPRSQTRGRARRARTQPACRTTCRSRCSARTVGRTSRRSRPESSATDVIVQRPLSVVVWGNSCAFMTMPIDADGRGAIYGEVLRDRLAAAGVPATLRVQARWFDFLTRAVRRYESDIRPELPDVLVLQFGLNEAQPWLMPTRLIGHLLAEDRAVTRSARAYRRWFANRAWRRLRAYRRILAGPVGTRTWQTTPGRFEGTLRRAIRMTRYELGALVLVLDVNPPGSRLEHFLPGMTARHDRIRAAIESAVRSFDDPGVRLVRSSAVVEELGVDTALPDGLHFNADAHRLVGERLADEVLSWLADARPAARRRPRGSAEG
jgi:lysophospholipase L1-like esterase